MELDYGSVVFVTDPTLTSDVYATFQFDNFPHTPLQRTSDEYGHTTLDFEMPDNWQVSPDAPEALLTVTLPADALTRLTLDLEVGDVHLDDLQLQSLKVELDNGSLYADDLTVTRDLEADISIGGCLIRQLSGTKQANISAYRSIHLCLDGDPADYTIDARTDNVICASCLPTPGVFSSWSGVASFTAPTLLNWASRALESLGPTPGTSVRVEE